MGIIDDYLIDFDFVDWEMIVWVYVFVCDEVLDVE